jgi:hypothetical protein
MKIRRLALLLLLVLPLAYIATFSAWWLTSPSETLTESGRIVRYVNFHMTPFRWHTKALWEPAFLTMEQVFGYRCVAVVAAEEDSIYTYAK